MCFEIYSLTVNRTLYIDLVGVDVSDFVFDNDVLILALNDEHLIKIVSGKSKGRTYVYCQIECSGCPPNDAKITKRQWGHFNDPKDGIKEFTNYLIDYCSWNGCNYATKDDVKCEII